MDEVETKSASIRLGEDESIPQTGPEAILYALEHTSVDDLEKRATDALKEGKKTKRAGAVALLHIVQGMRRNKQTPSDYMITAVPVVPPNYRPFAAQGGSFIPGDANILYKDLFDVLGAYNEEREMFGNELAGESRLALYDQIKSVYGYGDPVKPKTKAKEVKGFLQKLTGTTSKFGYVNRKLLSKTQDNTGRSTIIVEPDYGIDEIGIPEPMAFKMYAPYIQRRLKMLGLRDAEALKHVVDQTPQARKALEEEMKTRPVLYSRAPAWHMFNILGGHPKLVDGAAIRINPYVTTGLNADFDGDTINVHVPASDAAVKEAYDIMMPSKTPFSNRDQDKIVPLPKQEQILGLFTAATSPATTPVNFATEEEAIHAVRTGKIPLSADVTINGVG